MPFQNNSDLPKKVTDNLPKHAQDMYLAAYNSAFDQYENADERKHERSREETAHAVAWSAVERTYEKNAEGEWVKKSD